MKTIFAFIMAITLFLSGHAADYVMVEGMAQPFLKEFSVYPNPTSGHITITLEAIDETRSLELKVYSLIGQEMMQERIPSFSGSQKMEINLSTLPKGMYMIEISNGEKTRIKRVSVI